ncbi:unnamed protein product [Echinostoma caproni]|uniref:Reverse transcriptase domain-containing protein n=1 Tax=Echinostoma caproni TaxID=27848 RepID=A0A183AQE4_9TREM|nr:unnamed protein product [Echinostoma caproni]
MLNWPRDFFIDRNFCVCVGKSLSAWYCAPSGVPQGSFLGSLLFVVYVNDLPGQPFNPSLMYADGVKMWCTIEGANDRNSLQVDLNNLAQLADAWFFH